MATKPTKKPSARGAGAPKGGMPQRRARSANPLAGASLGALRGIGGKVGPGGGAGMPTRPIGRAGAVGLPAPMPGVGGPALGGFPGSPAQPGMPPAGMAPWLSQQQPPGGPQQNLLGNGTMLSGPGATSNPYGGPMGIASRPQMPMQPGGGVSPSMPGQRPGGLLGGPMGGAPPPAAPGSSNYYPQPGGGYGSRPTGWNPMQSPFAMQRSQGPM